MKNDNDANLLNIRELLNTPLEKVAELSTEQLLQLSTIQTTDEEEKLLRKLSTSKIEKLTFTDKITFDKLQKISNKCKEYRNAATLVLSQQDSVQHITRVLYKSYSTEVTVDNSQHLIVLQPTNFESNLQQAMMQSDAIQKLKSNSVPVNFASQAQSPSSKRSLGKVKKAQKKTQKN